MRRLLFYARLFAILSCLSALVSKCRGSGQGADRSSSQHQRSRSATAATLVNRPRDVPQH